MSLQFSQFTSRLEHAVPGTTAPFSNVGNVQEKLPHRLPNKAANSHRNPAMCLQLAIPIWHQAGNGHWQSKLQLHQTKA